MKFFEGLKKAVSVISSLLMVYTINWERINCKVLIDFFFFFLFMDKMMQLAKCVWIYIEKKMENHFLFGNSV